MLHKKKLIKIILLALIIYLAIGVLFALYAWSAELKTFTCTAPDEPHNTIGRGGMWNNPDPERCSRRGFELRTIASLPLLTVGWPVFLGGQMVDTNLNAPESDESENTAPVSLEDDESTYAGVYHESVVENGLKSFSGPDFGISLQYPADHLLFSGDRTITIAPQEAMLQSIARARSGAGGEGPPGIHFTFFAVPNQSVSLEEWIRTNPRSNWKLALPPWEEQENTLTPTTVAGGKMVSGTFMLRCIYGKDTKSRYRRRSLSCD